MLGEGNETTSTKQDEEIDCQWDWTKILKEAPAGPGNPGEPIKEKMHKRDNEEGTSRLMEPKKDKVT